MDKASKIPVAVFLASLPALVADTVHCKRRMGQIDCWRISDAQEKKLAEALPQASFAFCEDEASFVRELAFARVAVTWSFKRDWLKAAPELEWIATPAAGHDYYSLENAQIRRTYGSFHGRIIGETVVGMLLAHSRGLLKAREEIARGDMWPRAAIAPFMRTLRGSHVVILGYGAIGKWIASYLRAFDMKITGIRRHAPYALDATSSAAELAIPAATDCQNSGEALDIVLRDADYLVMALPADSSTDSIMDARRLAELPHGAVVCNVGRGNAIDETALVSALNSGHLGAALLDVASQEPPGASSPLYASRNLYLFPHSSAIAPEYLDLYIDEFVGNFRLAYPCVRTCG